MSVNYELAFSGHLEEKKNTTELLLARTTPVRQQILPFLRCVPKNNQEGYCQESTIRVDTPFKMVVVDIVGWIASPSEAGHRYILTLVDYATRYPEAVTLKKITTEAVFVALLDTLQ